MVDLRKTGWQATDNHHHQQVPDLEQTLAAMLLQTSLSSDNFKKFKPLLCPPVAELQRLSRNVILWLPLSRLPSTFPVKDKNSKPLRLHTCPKNRMKGKYPDLPPGSVTKSEWMSKKNLNIGHTHLNLVYNNQILKYKSLWDSRQKKWKRINLNFALAHLNFTKFKEKIWMILIKSEWVADFNTIAADLPIFTRNL